MIDRLKKTLVESFIGAIALGWVFAQSILHFAYVFSSPVASWLTRREYPGLLDRSAIHRGFSPLDAVPELLRSLALLVLGYVLLRWLYFKPLKEETTAPYREEDV